MTGALRRVKPRARIRTTRHPAPGTGATGATAGRVESQRRHTADEGKHTMEQTTEKNEYDLQAEKFLTDHGIKFTAKYITHGIHFPGDKDGRDIWRLTLTRGNTRGRRISVRFGQSVASQGETPRAYSLLTCLTKYDPGTFSEFCREYGYDEDSRSAERTYKAVVKEWKQVAGFFSSAEIEALGEIQ